MEARRRRFSFAFSLRGLALFVVGLSIGLAAGLHYSPFRKMVPNEAFAYQSPEYIIEPPDVLSIQVDFPNLEGFAISQESMVGPDGAVQVGPLGSIDVTGLTVREAEARIAKSASTMDAKARADVAIEAYNSKKYYLITESPLGDSIVMMPFTGRDHVLDALSHLSDAEPITGLRIWISRPGPGKTQVLPVNYEAITAGADPLSNYQLLPGDRLFVSSKPAPKP